MDVGTTLRTARERCQLSVEGLARRTKISPTHIKALEENAFDRLPRGIFARGFLRAYATEVGLDPDAIVTQYLEQTGIGSHGGHSPGAPVPPPASASPARQAPPAEPVAPGRALGGYVLLAAGLLFALVLYNRMPAPERASRVDSGAGTVDIREDAGDAAPTSGGPLTSPEAADAVQAVAADGTRMRIEIAPQGPCWVEVRADGRQLVYRLMNAGERESFDVRDEVSIRVGDPGAFAFSINGQPARAVGRSGMPTTVRVTPENYQQFLAR